MEAREFDKRFDEGKDISECLDVSKARRPEQEQKGSTWISRHGWFSSWTKRQNASVCHANPSSRYRATERLEKAGCDGRLVGRRQGLGTEL